MGSTSAQILALAAVEGSSELGVQEAFTPAQRMSHYNGVVPVPGGQWSAKIYEQYTRVWLGTFDSEDAAARAYDVAAICFRGEDEATINFQASVAATDLAFLATYSKAEIVEMLRKNTYEEVQKEGRRAGLIGAALPAPTPAWARELLFEKTLRSSDTAKYNRLILPKQQAELHFPILSTPEKKKTCKKGLYLTFEDVAGEVWRFRYMYWGNSGNYLLTTGWNRFVQEKGLTAGDVVVFSGRCAPVGSDEQFFIDYKKANAGVMLFGVNIAGGGHPA